MAFLEFNQDLSRVTQSSVSPDLGGNTGLKKDWPVEMPKVPSLNEIRIWRIKSGLLESLSQFSTTISKFNANSSITMMPTAQLMIWFLVSKPDAAAADYNATSINERENSC